MWKMLLKRKYLADNRKRLQNINNEIISHRYFKAILNTFKKADNKSNNFGKVLDIKKIL